ncbi:hypothetical protein MmiEs2_14480 [Methanimicrococcus stummii]|uniref:Uncharacterized protein n=1 Tax=Methanimicrococcus stummii TaxID=3028294 RepID=A0AA96VC72_9EURY|nr:hypothetical protein [Methanimicrococcus sp. Es2]WNY29223.1 hypothetical protein MmiEs2_14480 [Methanimicrococcus sp. Es2]
MTFTILEFNSYLQNYSQDSILSDLSSFKSRDGSEDLCRFLQENFDENGMRIDNFIDFERNHLCRIYFVLTNPVEKTEDNAKNNTENKCVLNLKTGTYPIYGYFSIAARTLYAVNIDKNQDILPPKNIVIYLVGHLCKNVSYEWKNGGEYMLQQCFEIIESVHQKIGIKYVLIECNEDLVEYYSAQHFKKIGFNKKSGLYQMIRGIETIEKPI